MSSTRAPGSIISAMRRRSRRRSLGAGTGAVAGCAALTARRSVALRLIGSRPEAGDAAMLGAPGQEAAQGREQLGLVQQEGVMSLVGLDLDKADIRRDSVEGVDERPAFRGREQPVAGEGDDAETRLPAGKGGRQRPAMLGGKVEIIHRPSDVEVGVGVEAVDEGAALMAQIALDLEV